MLPKFASFYDEEMNENYRYYFCSDEAGPSETGICDSDGRRTRYNAGPKSGTNDIGRSHEPLLNLYKQDKSSLREFQIQTNGEEGHHWFQSLTISLQSYHCKPRKGQMLIVE